MISNNDEKYRIVCLARKDECHRLYQADEHPHVLDQGEFSLLLLLLLLLQPMDEVAVETQGQKCHEHDVHEIVQGQWFMAQLTDTVIVDTVATWTSLNRVEHA